MLSRGQHDGKAELDNGSWVRCFSEQFDDVVAALEAAHRDGVAVVRVMRHDEIAAAKPQFPMPFAAGDAMTDARKQTLLDAHVDAPSDAFDEAVARTVGQARDGDLRISPNSINQLHYWLEICTLVDDIPTWGSEGLPFELRASWPTRDELIKAVSLAGYSRRLKRDA